MSVQQPNFLNLQFRLETYFYPMSSMKSSLGLNYISYNSQCERFANRVGILTLILLITYGFGAYGYYHLFKFLCSWYLHEIFLSCMRSWLVDSMKKVFFEAQTLSEQLFRIQSKLSQSEYTSPFVPITVVTIHENQVCF